MLPRFWLGADGLLFLFSGLIIHTCNSTICDLLLLSYSQPPPFSSLLPLAFPVVISSKTIKHWRERASQVPRAYYWRLGVVAKHHYRRPDRSKKDKQTYHSREAICVLKVLKDISFDLLWPISGSWPFTPLLHPTMNPLDWSSHWSRVSHVQHLLG